MAQELGSPRRQLIIDAAIDQFRRFGYGAVGMAEIGEAAGITGPGIYRHFKDKSDLLGAIARQSAEHLSEEFRRVQRGGGRPRQRLVRLVEVLVDAVTEDRVLVSAYYQERHLPEADRKRIRAANRRNVREWIDLLCEVRSDLSPGEARLAVLGVWQLVEAVGRHEGDVDGGRLKELFRSLAIGALLGGSA